jgi:hypothetical protein
MQRRAVILQIIEFSARCACAILVATLAAAFLAYWGATAFGYDLIAMVSGTVFVGLPSGTIAYLTAAAGIYLGSLCFNRASRTLVCVMLTILGVVAYQICWSADWQYAVRHEKHGKDSLAPLIAIAGLSVCALTFLISRKRSKSDPTCEKPVVEKV